MNTEALPIPVMGHILIKFATVKKTDGGLIIPDDAQGETGVGEIVAISSEFQWGSQIHKMFLEAGDRIIYRLNRGIMYKEDMRFIEMLDVVAKL